MRITTKVVIDIALNAVEYRESYECNGPISFCKGADTANSQRQQELDMQTSANAFQMAMMNQLKNDFSKYTTGAGQGFSPQQLAASRTQYLNSNNSTFNQAGQQVREALGARGEGTGTAPVGGSYGTGIAQLMAAKAGSQSQGLLGIDATNAQQALQNKFNAGNILSGNAAILTGTQGVAGAGASSALGAYIQGKNTGFGSSLANSFGGALGKGFGAGLIGGFGSMAAGNGFGSGFSSGTGG